jgi:hypothetical protein
VLFHAFVNQGVLSSRHASKCIGFCDVHWSRFQAWVVIVTYTKAQTVGLEWVNWPLVRLRYWKVDHRPQITHESQDIFLSCPKFHMLYPPVSIRRPTILASKSRYTPNLHLEPGGSKSIAIHQIPRFGSLMEQQTVKGKFALLSFYFERGCTYSSST